MARGKFIIFEGMDYSGKTTNIQNFCSILDSMGIDYINTREPGGSRVAEDVRRLILAPDSNLTTKECVLAFQLARSHHCRNVIEPALEAGKWVVCDRYIISSMVYQYEEKKLLSFLTKQLNLTEPDHMVYSTCGIEDTLRRKGIRGVDNHMDELFTNRYTHYSGLFDFYACLLEDMSLTLDTNNSPSALKVQMEEYIVKDILGEQNV